MAASGIRHRHDCGRHAPRTRIQLAGGRRDEAQRALGADEQLLQVVAGVVLAQGAQPVEDPPVRQHDLEAEDQFAGRSVAEHVRAAGIGREVAAELAAALGSEAQGEKPIRFGSGRLQRRQHAAGLRSDRVIVGIQLPDGRHAPCREDDLRLGRRGAGHSPANQTSIAALGNDADAAGRSRAAE